MNSARGRTPADLAAVHEIVLVTAPGCHFCDDARLALEELGESVPLTVREVDPLDHEGMAVVERYRPTMWPVVVLDGALFSVGRLPRAKLRAQLERAGASI